jgi:hypothetical protein
MTQDLDKTIEDLEKEVVAELEEKAHDAPMKSAGKPDPMPKMKGAEKPEDLGGATPDKPVAKSPDSAKKIKHKTDDPAMKGAVKAEGYSDEEIRELCHSKDHDCATVVEHPVYGKGKPILKSHAIPDDNGFVEWYDVQFKHGIEEKVMAKDMKIIEESSHNKETKNMTKDNMIGAMKDMIAQMNKEKKDVIQSSYEAMTKAMEGEHEGEHEDGHKMETKKEYYEVDIKADVAALVEGENFSDEFKGKAETIFEAAVSSKIKQIEDKLTEEHEKSLAETKEDMIEKVDSYLNYVTEEWKKENELAIERGLKGEIAEDFITGLKSLFEDHYIDVPNEKYDILEAQTQEIEELKNKVNDLIESKKGSVNRIGELVKESLVAKASDDLSETQKEKFKGLVEEVEFVSEESYSEKLKTLKESYFPNEEKKEEVLNEEPTTNNIDSSDVMAAYTAAIKKTHKRALNN